MFIGHENDNSILYLFMFPQYFTLHVIQLLIDHTNDIPILQQYMILCITLHLVDILHVSFIYEQKHNYRPLRTPANITWY